VAVTIRYALLFLACYLGSSHAAWAEKSEGAPCPTVYQQFAGPPAAAEEPKQLRKARARAEKELGFELRYTVQEGTVRAYGPDGQRLGYLGFELRGRTTINIEDLYVEEEFRRRGLSEAMMAEILRRNPLVDRIETDSLVATNGKVLKKALKKGYSCKDAIRATPAYQMRKRLGFGKLKSFSCEDVTFTVKRD